MSTFNRADILVPAKTVDPTKWSVVACDQYTSEPEYWERVSENVGDAPSALNIIFPEVYLDEGDARIESINKTMEKYMEDGIFEEKKSAMIYVERSLGGGKIRRGIIGAVDLEDYDFSKGSTSKIRATEGTVLERIPPRVKIRENAALELPHIMLLMNDAEKTVIGDYKSGEEIYDFDLMENSGHLRGWLMTDEEVKHTLDALCALDRAAEGNLLFAVGDGNHSLATAKTCWENVKKGLSDKERETHPARFCLVEIENIHDSALEFEPIHRVIFDTEPAQVIEDIMKYYPESSHEDNGGHHITYMFGDTKGELYIQNSGCALAVGALQKYLDARGFKTDYIHGDDTVEKLSKKAGSVGFILPAMEKGDLFKSVIADGALPRKTFSMGEAQDKKFYLEAKKIK